MRRAVDDMHLRARVLRKERAVGVYPGGEELVTLVPSGHGSSKLKREALDEIVLRVMDEMRLHSQAATDSAGEGTTASQSFVQNLSESTTAATAMDINERIITTSRDASPPPSPSASRAPPPPQPLKRTRTSLPRRPIRLPYCAFNGGRDAWVDVGDKSIGVQTLQVRS